jgi:hypothetical protein
MVACLLLISTTAGAIELRSVVVEHDDGQYTLQSNVWFDVDQQTLFAVFADWDLGTQFSSMIVESRNLEPDELGRAGFHTQNRGCLLFFCTSVVREGYVESEPPAEIRAVADPERSDFEFSNEVWSFATEGSGTVVHYEIVMKPKFWVPPLIGPYIIKRKLRKSGGEALGRIEKIAQETAAQDD